MSRAVVNIGSKFFLTTDKEYHVYRVKAFDDKEIHYIDDNTREAGSIDLETFHNTGKKLVPDGKMFFFAVTYQNTPDVLVTYAKGNNFKENGSFDVYLRQNISDLYYIEAGSNTQKAGCCVLAKSIPDSVGISQFTSYDSITDVTMLDTYINDCEATILDIMSDEIPKYDAVLSKNMDDALMRNGEDLGVGVWETHNGYCRTVKSLLRTNAFWSAMDTANEVLALADDISEFTTIVARESDGGEFMALDEEATQLISAIYNRNITKTIAVKYEHDMSLDDVNGEYILIRDKNNDLYVVRFLVDNKELTTEFINKVMQANYNMLRNDQIRK